MSDGFVEAGWAMVQAANYQAAEKYAKQALENDPNDVDALSLLARAFYLQYDFQRAVETNEQLLRLNPRDIQGHLNRVHIAMHRGHYDDSKAAIADFERTFPKQFELSQSLKAFWELQFGNINKSIKALRSLRADHPDDTVYQKYLGLAEYEARNPFKADESLSEVLGANANDDDILEALAFIRFRQFAFSEACFLADRARKITPEKTPLRWVDWGRWLVMIPPFFVGHIQQWISAKVAQMTGPAGGHLVNAGWLIATIGAILKAAEMNQSLAGIDPWQSWLVLGFVFSTGWALAAHYAIGEEWNPDLVPRRGGGKKVKLDDY